MNPIRIITWLTAGWLASPLAGADLAALKKKAAKGNAQAQYELGETNFWGRGTPFDHNATVHWAGKAAEQEHALGLYRLAVIYMLGQGAKQDVLTGIQLMEEALPGLRRLADEGNVDAQLKLGLILQFGVGVDVDMKSAVEWQRAAAKAESPMAQFAYGHLFYMGYGVSRDLKAARAWYLKAAQLGQPRAQNNLSGMLYEGVGGPADPLGAAQWMRKAAEQGYDAAQYDFALMLAGGYGVPKDEKESVQWMRKAARQGYPPAQVTLGKAFDRGLGTPRDLKEAYAWYTLAARNGNDLAARLRSKLKITDGGIILAARKQAEDFVPQRSAVSRRSLLGVAGAGELTLLTLMIEAQKIRAQRGGQDAKAKLADWYFKGLTLNGRVAVKKDSRKALQLARELAEAGHVAGCWQLGVFYTIGLKAPPPGPGKDPVVLIKPDPVQRFKWMIQAAEKGMPEAQLVAGQAYENATGTGRDFKKALGWYREASTQGDVRASHAISMMYRAGRDKVIPKDPAKWEQWLRKSADLGFVMAQMDLGRSLHEGDNIKKNHKEARTWLLRAARQGYPVAQHAIAVMLLEGKGGPRDPIRGIKWALLAARANYRDARILLQDMANTITPAQRQEAINLAQAFIPRVEHTETVEGKTHADVDVKTLQAAAQQGKPEAQYELGRLYALGIGLKVDRVKAYKWLALADRQGHPTAGEVCRNVMKKMSSTEKKEGLKAVFSFKKTAAPK